MLDNALIHFIERKNKKYALILGVANKTGC